MCMFVDLCLPVGVIFLVELRAESDIVLSFARNDSFFKNSAHYSNVACDVLSRGYRACGREPAISDHLL